MSIGYGKNKTPIIHTSIKTIHIITIKNVWYASISETDPCSSIVIMFPELRLGTSSKTKKGGQFMKTAGLLFIIQDNF